MGFRHGSDRHRGHARNQPAGAGHRHRHYRSAVSRSALLRKLSARKASSFRPGRDPDCRIHLFDTGSDVRRGHGDIRHFRIPLYDFRCVPGSLRGGAVLHGSRHRTDRQMAWRSGQDRGPDLRFVWIDFRFFGRQRGVDRDIHHPADEADRLQAPSCRCHRGHRVDRRSDHAAGHGRGRLHSRDADAD